MAGLVILMLVAIAMLDSSGQPPPSFRFEWVDFAWMLLHCYFAFEVVAWCTARIRSRNRQFGVLWLLFVVAAFAVPLKMQTELDDYRKAVAEVVKIEQREMNRDGKMFRQVVQTSSKPENPIEYSMIGEQQHVTGLNFSIEEDIGCGCCFSFIKTKIDDSEFAVFGRLRELKRLTVSRSSITDAGIGSLRGASKLEALDISHNEISDSGMSDLENLRNLKELSIANTKVTDAGIEHLKKLPKLKVLDASNCLVTDAALRSLAECGQLEELKLEGTRIDGFELRQIERMKNLKRIHFATSKFVDSRLANSHEQLLESESSSVNVKGLDNLEQVNLYLFPIFDSLRFEDLAKLERLSLTLKKPGPNSEADYRNTSLSFRDLPSLTYALIANEGEIHFSNLPNLRTISLSPESGQCLENLHQIENLERLSLNCLRLKNPDALLQIEQLPSLQSLTIGGGSRLNDRSLGVLKSLPNLKKLTIYEGEFSAAGLKFLSNNRHLEELQLPDVKDSGEPLKSLNGMKNLRKLQIGLGNIGTLHLQGLKSLERFHVAANIGSLRMQGIDRLEHLTFSPEQGIERVSLQDMKSLKVFNLQPSKVIPLKFVSLSGLPKVATLRLASLQPNPHVNDQALEHLATFKSLSDLNLENANVTNELLRQIEQLPGLERLILTGTEIESHTRTRSRR